MDAIINLATRLEALQSHNVPSEAADILELVKTNDFWWQLHRCLEYELEEMSGKEPSLRFPPPGCGRLTIHVQKTRDQIKKDFLATLAHWQKQHAGKVWWLVLCHGYAQGRMSDFWQVIPESLRDKSALFLVDIEPGFKPDAVMDITKDLWMIPKNSFHHIIEGGCSTIYPMKELQRIIPKGGYWIGRYDLIHQHELKLAPPLVVLEKAFFYKHKEPPRGHFIQPYKLKYRIPPKYEKLMSKYFQVAREEAKRLGVIFNLSIDWSKPPADVDKYTLYKRPIFERIFGMTPEQFITLSKVANT